MARPEIRRLAAAVTAGALGSLGLAIIGGGVASAVPGSVTWDDGNERITRTISDVNPGPGGTITVTTQFDRTGGVVEYIEAVKDYHPTCWTYVSGSAKVDGSARTPESQGADFVRVTGSWALYPSISPNLRTFEFSYKIGADCAREVALQSTVHYAGTLGAGNYTDKGPAVTVRKDASTTSLAAVSGAKVGQSSQLTATVTGGAAGNTVEFYDGTTKIGEGPLVGNSVSIGWTPTTAGAHSISAKFLATAIAVGSQSAAQSVQVAAADVATSTSLEVPATTTTGQSVDLKATVSPVPAGGTVQFKDGATNIGSPVALTNGVATLPHSFDAAGGKSITAVYSGAAGFLTSTSAVGAVTVTDPDAATSISLEVPATATTGQAVELKATVSPTPGGGTVQFKDGDVNIGAPVAVTAGVATLSHTFDAAGAKSITAVYSGVAGFLGSTSTAGAVTVTDPDAATATTLEVPAAATTGEAVELKATVSPAPTGGTVQFKDGDVNIGAPVAVTNGVATLSHSFDTAGGKSITAVFSGVAGFLTSTSPAATVTVSDPAPTDVATTVLSSAPASAKVGAAVDLVATVTPSHAQGTVQFTDGDVNIGGPVTVADGVASFSHVFDSAGSKSITAVFVGGPGFLDSTSQPVTVTVSDPLPTDVETTTTIVVPATATVGQTVVLTATVAPTTAGGTVQFKDGDRAIGLPAAIVDGKATLSYSFPAAGTKNITAVYSGGTGHTASTSDVGVVTVSAAPAQGGGGSLENIFGS